MKKFRKNFMPSKQMCLVNSEEAKKKAARKSIVLVRKYEKTDKLAIIAGNVCLSLNFIPLKILLTNCFNFNSTEKV